MYGFELTGTEVVTCADRGPGTIINGGVIFMEFRMKLSSHSERLLDW
jgi:hypothetical protein